MTISSEVIAAARAAEEEEDVEAAVLLAVAMVETNARAFTTVGDRAEPLIRFEGHYFDRLLGGEERRRARAAGLASPKAGAVRNPAGQEARWMMLERAAAINRPAAYASTSWGLGQVMGSHWKTLGFPSMAAFAALARESALGQFTIVARFLRKGALHRRLREGDAAGFARRYNGPGFAKNAYDTKVAAAYRRALALCPPEAMPLSLGSRGTRVAVLQASLTRAGFALVEDGIFGPLTERALSAFQAGIGLPPSGVFDRATQAGLAPAA